MKSSAYITALTETNKDSARDPHFAEITAVIRSISFLKGLAMRCTQTESLKSAVAVVAIGILFVVPVAAGMAVFTDPLAADRSPDWVSLGPLEALPADGVARRVPVRVSETDAWARQPECQTGTVFVMRSSGKDGIRAFKGTYHCGAQVEFDEMANQFVVPCWEGIRFTPDGRRLHSVREWGDLRGVRARVVDGELLALRADLVE